MTLIGEHMEDDEKDPLKNIHQVCSQFALFITCSCWLRP
jgi:hypothetical protein